MSEMNRKQNDYCKMLRYYFERNDVDISKEELESAVVSLNSLGIFELYNSDENTYYYLIKTKMSDQTPEKIVSKLPEKFKVNAGSKILVIVSNIQDKFNINKPEFKKQIKDLLTKKYSLKNRISTIEDISAEFVGEYKKKHVVSISNRVDSLSYQIFQNKDETDGCNVRGNVYIASLQDIVNIYNAVGDTLFDYNVRYSIADELNVEKEIQKTLSECPEKFWFYNNGITVIVNRKGFACDCPRSVEFKGDNTFSIINGAQTITTAAKWYSSEDEDKKKNFDQAKVLLRVIIVDDMNSSFVKDISVSLNRQKSISGIDIANTYDFVKDINQYMNQCDNDSICFEINKRGGTPSYKKSYYINDFAQFVKAYLGQKPGVARTGKGSLINGNMKDGKYVFNDNEIFKPITSSEDIVKYYSPVNYVSDLYGSYRKISKQFSNQETLKAKIWKYCNMYCIASVVYCINNRDIVDFSDFTYINHNYNELIAEKFIELFEEFLNEKKILQVDSNDFKKDELYKEFKVSSQMDDLYGFIQDLKIGKTLVK